MKLDVFTLSLIFTAVFVGIISLGTAITKLTMSSGVIESRAKKGQKVIPKVIDEVVSMGSLDTLKQFDEVYRVPRELTIQKSREIATLYLNDVILHFPFSNEIQDSTGVFLFHFNRRGMKKTAKKRTGIRTDRSFTFTINKGSSRKITEKVEKKDRRIHLEGSAVHRISKSDWKNLKENLIQLSRDEFATFLGFQNIEELDKKLIEAVQNTVKIQEQVRSRIRGVPAPSFKGVKQLGSKMVDNKLIIPTDLLSKLNLTKDEEVEIIQGKDEYLFYVKRKK
jgi:hypothetical protein